MKRVSDIDLRLLRVFVSVVEAGGYGAAQSALNVGTSTISLHMSDLEARLGFRLCSRGRGGFRLTEQGRLAYEETRRFLTYMDEYVGQLAALRSELAGKLVIGAVDALLTHPEYPIAKAIRRFNQKPHHVHIELVISSRDDLERGVLDGSIHVAVVPFLRQVDGLHFKPLFTERHELYCGRCHPLFGAGEGPVPDAELAKHRFVLRRYQAELDRARFANAEHGATVQTMEAMLTLLLSGSYLGFLPDHFAAEWVNNGKLRTINSDTLGYSSRHMLILPTSRPLTHALSAFLSAVAAG